MKIKHVVMIGLITVLPCLTAVFAYHLATERERAIRASFELVYSIQIADALQNADSEKAKHVDLVEMQFAVLDAENSSQLLSRYPLAIFAGGTHFSKALPVAKGILQANPITIITEGALKEHIKQVMAETPSEPPKALHAP